MPRQYRIAPTGTVRHIVRDESLGSVWCNAITAVKGKPVPDDRIKRTLCLKCIKSEAAFKRRKVSRRRK